MELFAIILFVFICFIVVCMVTLPLVIISRLLRLIKNSYAKLFTSRPKKA